MGNSKIEWTEQTWNPIVGCSIVSPGCTNCYAMKMAARIEAMNASVVDYSRVAAQYAGTTKRVNGKAVWTGKLAQAPEAALLAPLKRKKPTTYFVNSMGDLFHEDCPDDWIDKVFAVMALCPQHTFQVLTKRAKRKLEYFFPGPETLHTRWLRAARDVLGHSADGYINGLWPLPNVWLGVSTERQQEADERIPLLLQTPAAVRFISAEPLLGPIDLKRIDLPGGHEEVFPLGLPVGRDEDGPQPHLDWVIAGGESGKNARPMHPDWFRSLRDQCAAAGVAFFFKQWGEYAPSSEQEWIDDDGSHRHMLIAPDGRHGDTVADMMTQPKGTAWMRRVGKKAAGRHLDGVFHDAMPQSDGRGRG